MASLLEKVSTLISANLHYIVDEALKSNNLAVIDQYVRQVENNLRRIGRCSRHSGRRSSWLKRRLDEQEQRYDEIDRPR